MKDGQIDLTIVVTAHDEGLLAHKTMVSVLEAAGRLKTAGYSYEVVIHIDNGDKETKRYFKRYSNMDDFRIFENEFGDTGPSRNYAVKKARGKYVAFLDGDDLISPNWYLFAIRTLEEAKRDIIVHPEAILTFGLGRSHVLTLQSDSFDDDRDTLVLLGENRWCSVLIAKKEILQETPYRILGDGYGHEDYIFNIETLEKKIPHVIVKNTVLFYRRSENSRLANGNIHHVIIPAMKMFDFNKVKNIQIRLKSANTKKTLKEKGYKIYKKIRGNDALNYFITPIAKMTLGVLEHTTSIKRRSAIPEFVIDEWIRMNHIDSQLYPYKNEINEVSFYKAEEQLAVGNTFLKIAEKINKIPDYVFIVPWMVRGGADKVLLNYIEALKELHPEWNFAVIATLPARNVWADRLPEYVDYVNFGELTEGLPPEIQDTLMSRLITQLRCDKLHIINSEFGYNWVYKHFDLVKNHYELFVSLFAWEYIHGSKMRAVYSYDNPYLFEIFSAVKKVLTDNRNIIKYTCEHNGFSTDKFEVHYQPIRDLKIEGAKSKPVHDGKLRLMWAGRVVPEKMPELVAEIGRMVDVSKISIDVYGEIGKDVRPNVFDNIPAVQYCGEFDGFSSLPVEKYDALLYTSLNDGMPNVILEATAAGLPVIASNDGGVGEFIKNKKTGVLIEDYLKPESYVKAINESLENFDELKKYVDNAQKLLREQHGWEKFVEVVRRDIE